MGAHTVLVEAFWSGAWHLLPVLSTRGTLTIKRGVSRIGDEPKASTANPIIDNGSELYSPRAASSALFGLIGQNTPIRITVDGSTRIYGDAAAWKPQRPIRGSGWTDVAVAGVLQRIGRGIDPFESPVTRATLALGPVSYWPLETGVGALTQGTAPLDVNAGRTITWADSTALVGSLPLPKVAVKDEVLSADSGFPSPTALSGVANATSATGWSVGCWVIAVPHSSAPATASVTYALQWGGYPTGASARAWELSIASGTGWTAASEVFVNMGVSNYALRGIGEIMDGRPHHLMVTASQTSPNNITIVLYVDGVAYTTGSNPNPATPFTLTPVTFIYAGGEREPTGSPEQWIGHVVVFDRVLSASDVTALYAARDGYTGETAGTRFLRVCAEEGITATVTGSASDTEPMGPQPVATFTEILTEISRTDNGLLFEDRSAVNALVMVAGQQLLNQTSALTLPYRGGIVPGLTPVVGDEHIRNDVTAADSTGATRRVQQLTGPYNVRLPAVDPAGVGRYATRIEVNPADPAQLVDAAGWRVNEGTYGGTWYAEVTADLDAAPWLAAAAATVDVGQVISLEGLPVDEALTSIDHIVIGLKEEISGGGKRRTITFLCVPAEPYRVGILANTAGDADPILGHLETDGSVTAGSTAAGASTFSAATTSGPLWTTDSDDFPLDVIAGGQRISVSAIASPVRDTFTRSASSGWGPADSGQQWVVGAGTASLFSATGTVGQIAVSALNTEHHIAVNVGYAPYQRVRAYLTLGVTPTGAAINWGVMLRRADALNLYWIDVQIGVGGSLTLRVISKIGGANTQLTTAPSATVHSTSVARILLAEIDAGNIIRVKVYDSGSPEPGWELVYDASAVVGLSSGPSVGCIARLTVGNTNAAPVNFAFDNFAVLNPQEFTVQPTGRQVVYPVPSGSAVNVQQPIILTQ